jgi:hypothetical protein
MGDSPNVTTVYTSKVYYVDSFIFYMKIIFVPHRKHLYDSTTCYGDSFNFCFILPLSTAAIYMHNGAPQRTSSVYFPVTGNGPLALSSVIVRQKIFVNNIRGHLRVPKLTEEARPRKVHIITNYTIPRCSVIRSWPRFGAFPCLHDYMSGFGWSSVHCIRGGRPEP